MASTVPTVRDLLEQLADWHHRLVAPHLPLEKEPVAGGFRWKFREDGESALMLAKAVRAISGIRVALSLAERGFVTESATLLRVVSDMCVEIAAVSEGVRRGSLTTAQQQFVDQFFRPHPRSAEEYMEDTKQRYVAREELLKSLVRSAKAVGLDGERVRELKRGINRGYDAYVHGSYATAMELFDPRDGTFMLDGHKGEGPRQNHISAVTTKLHEVLFAVAEIAEAEGNAQVHDEVLEGIVRLEQSPEYRRAR